MVVQQERVCTVTKGREESGTPICFAINANVVTRLDRYEMNNKPVYKHYGQTEHDENGCFQLIEYPDWWGYRPRLQGCDGGRGSGCGTSSTRGQGD